jgi:hypothetical protein
MVVEYLDKKPYSREQLQDLVDRDRSGATWTIGLAKSAAQLGFRAEFYSSCLGFNPKNYELEFYKKEADDASSTERKLERLKKEAVELKVQMEERSLSLDEILTKINVNCVPIILLDWGKIKGTGKFVGHFVPIVGYDGENVYVHNQGIHNPEAFIPIKRGLFDLARKSPGTDEDIVFIHRKRNLTSG